MDSFRTLRQAASQADQGSRPSPSNSHDHKKSHSMVFQHCHVEQVKGDEHRTWARKAHTHAPFS